MTVRVDALYREIRGRDLYASRNDGWHMEDGDFDNMPLGKPGAFYASFPIVCGSPTGHLVA